MFCPHLRLHHPDLQHPQLPWKGVAETAQAHPLAGVGLAEWLTQHQTQVMSSSSPTYSATWTQRTRRAISPIATTISRTRTKPNVISTIDPVCRTQKHLAVAKQQQAEFLQRSGFQASGNRLQIMCRVDQASRKLGSNFGQRICCNNNFSSQSKGKRDRDTNVLLSLKDRISRKTLNGKLNRPFEER